MANSENQVELKLNLDVSGVQSALYDMIGDFTGTGKEFDKITKKIEDSFKNLEAVIKRYGADSKEAAVAAATYQRALTAMVANGVDPTVSSFQRLSGAISSSTSAIKSSETSVKKTNMAWTNIALVVQDLPFGFRGIQNNLPALFGSMAGGAGAAYLAFSALVAAITAVDMGLIKLGKDTKSTEDYTKDLAKTFSQEMTSLSSLYRVATDSNRTMVERKEAAKQLKEEYPGLLGKYSEEDIALGKAKSSYIELTNVISMYAKAKAAEGKLIEVNAKLLENQYQIDKKTKEIGQFTGRRYTGYGNEETSAFLLWKAKVYNGTKDLIKTQTELNGERDYYQQILDKNIISIGKLDEFKDKPTGGTVAKLEDKSIGTLKSKQQYYKDNILMFASYEQEIIRRQADLDIKQATLEGKKGSYIKEIIKTRDQDIENSAKNLADKLLKIQQDLGEEEGKELEKQAKTLEQDNKELNQLTKQRYQDQLSDVDQYYNNLLDFAVNDKNAQKEILMQKNAVLTEGLAIGALKYDDYVKRIADNTKKIGQITKAISEEAYKSMLQIGNGLMNALGPSFDMLIEKGASLGEVLTSAFQSLLKQLAKVVATALVAVILMSILFPEKLAAAGGFNKVLGGLIGQGMGLGGLIGGGANSAVNAVDATSGNNAISSAQASIPNQDGGSFVLRGNDLVLALNRSENSLNLRRGV